MGSRPSKSVSDSRIPENSTASERGSQAITGNKSKSASHTDFNAGDTKLKKGALTPEMEAETQNTVQKQTTTSGEYSDKNVPGIETSDQSLDRMDINIETLVAISTEKIINRSEHIDSIPSNLPRSLSATVKNTDVQSSRTEQKESTTRSAKNASEKSQSVFLAGLPSTDAEADEQRESLLSEFREHISALNNITLIPDVSVPPETVSALRDIAIHYSIQRYVSLKKQVGFRKELGRLLSETGADRKMCDIAVHMYRKGFRDSDHDWCSYFYCLHCLMNYSDRTVSLTVTIVAHPDFLTHMRETLNAYQESYLNESDTSKITYKVLELILAIVHNVTIADIDENIRRLREEHFTEAIMPYLKSKDKEIVLCSIVTLAENIDEKESELLQANTSAIDYLVRQLRLSMDSLNRRSLGWSCHEIARAIGRLARNDINKKSLVEFGAIPLLLELSKSEADTKEEEIKDAVQAIWALSFDEDNKLTVVNTEGLVDRLLELRKDSDKPIKHACSGILWTLRDTLKNTSKYCDIATQLFPSDDKSPAHEKKISYKTDADFQGHIMISYQWANQKTLIEVSSRLKAEKFAVWMDVDDMEGSTLQAMAEAIEKAHLVLICMSRKYKDSPNCRAEAEYAFQKRKTIVPLIMEKGYRPDGWLGMILGSKLFYDFSGKYPFESKIGGLIKEVEKGYKPKSTVDSVDGGGLAVRPASGQIEGIIQPERAPVASAPPINRDSEETIKKWTEEEVKKWSHENKVKRVNLNEIDGEDLLYIRNLQHTAPEFFYRVLENKLELSNVRDFRLFQKALNQL